jgi:[protein-PII] uridylyltransferase
LQAAASAVALAREVSRPDLLVLGALLHDVGKGLPGDHSVVGAPITEAIASDIGLPAADVKVIRDIVRWHLLLPEVATRRDLDDPDVIADVAAKVESVATLEILHMLARADAEATGPLAWSEWKGRLIDELVWRVRGALGGARWPRARIPRPRWSPARCP